MVTVLVASTSDQKVLATQEAFSSYFPDDIVEVFREECPSGVNEQPVGYNEIRQGAHNRLHKARDEHVVYDYYVSVEHGIVPLGDKRYDVGCVLLESQDGMVKEMQTKHILFPTDAVEEARKRGFARTTVGSILQEKYPSVDHTDPHTFLTQGAHPRAALIRDALLACLHGV